MRELHPDGTVSRYTALNDGKPANGWSKKKFYPDGSLQAEESFSNGTLIESIVFDESGQVTEHKLWNNRLKEMVNKPAPIPLTKHNVVTGYGNYSFYLAQLPSISAFIGAAYDEASLKEFFIASNNSTQPDTRFTLNGRYMQFTIYWDCHEVVHQWHCHCNTEELYLKARYFFQTNKML